MKKIVVSLVFCWCLCDAQVKNGGEAESCSGLLGCCGSLSLLQNVGTMGEKLANMADKIAVLEDTLQNTEKRVQELQSLVGGKSDGRKRFSLLFHADFWRFVAF